MSSGAVRACPVCGSQRLAFAFTVNSNIDGLMESKYCLLRCDVCGCGVTDPQPSSQELKQLYSQGIYQRSGGRMGGLIEYVLSQLQLARLREIER